MSCKLADYLALMRIMFVKIQDVTPGAVNFGDKKGSGPFDTPFIPGYAQQRKALSAKG